MTDRQLQLDRPLVVVDLETTGQFPNEDRIVEVSGLKLLPGGERLTFTRRVNPGRPIAADATRVHGIRDADVAGEPTFEQLAPELAAFLEGCDLAGFNLLGFDLPMLRAEFGRAGRAFPAEGTRVVDAYSIFVQREQRSLSAALSFYCGRRHDGAHGAEADVRATADVLLAQVARYADLPTDVAGLHELCVDNRYVDPARKFVWRDGEAVLNFSKLKGRPLRWIAQQERSFLEWMLKGDFPPESKHVAREALAGRFPQPPAGAAAAG